MNKTERMYVFPEFKKIIKMKANENGKTIIEWTKELTQSQDPLHQLFKSIRNKKNMKGGFDFV